jgi:hypothetical protein
MARLGTALERRREAPSAASPPGGALGRRVADALERRRAGAAERSPGSAGALAERLVDALERRLARAVTRRLAGATDRTPGAVEQRLVAIIERRLSRRPAESDRPRGLAGRRRAGWHLSTRQPTTLRALVVSLLARSIVRTLALLVRILGRAVVSRPVRRLARLLGRRAVHARPSRQAGILALLLAAIALLARALRRRLAEMSEGRRTAIALALRLARTLLPALGRLAEWVARELRRAVAARRET